MTYDTHVISYLDGVEYKGFIVKLDISLRLYEVKSTDGSELPHILTSKYTSPDTAHRAIDTYYAEK